MLRRRLLVTYLVFILSILLIMAVCVNYVVRNIIDQQTRQGTEASFAEGYSLINGKFTELNSTVLEISIDDQLQEHLHTIRALEEPALFDFMLVRSDHYRLGRVLGGENLSIYPVDAAGRLWTWSEQEYNYELLDAGQEEPPWLDYHRSGLGRVVIQPVDEVDASFVVVKNILSTRDWSTVLAVLCIEVYDETLNQLLNRIDLGQNSQVVIATREQVLLPVYRQGADAAALFDTGRETPYVSGDHMVFYRRLYQSDAYLVGRVYMETILERGRSVQRVFFGTGVVAVALSVMMAAVFTRTISRPIIEIADAMAHYRPGEFTELRATAQKKGEIRILNDSYNSMTHMIQNLIEDVYTARLNEKQAELMALQAQINPHFLYNTLDSINWMAMNYGAEDIQEMVESLATMLRHSLNNGENLISVRGEMEQLRSYIYIQKIRFDNSFREHFLIDSRILGNTIIKLILQPIVENAIIHGFADMESGGELIINGYLDGQVMVFDVLNNGRLIDPERMRRLLEDEDPGARKSYGVNNVNARLLTHYGEGWGIRYFVEEQYTVARIRIPVEPQPDKEVPDGNAV